MSEDYFAEEALSASGAKLLLPPNCPAIYRWQKDNPPESKPDFDFGHAAHKLVLGKGANILEIEADDWRKPATRDFREGAYAEGLIPLLSKDVRLAEAMAEKVRTHPVAGKVLGPGGVIETPIRWTRDGVNFKAKPDYFRVPDVGRPYVADYKTAKSSDPAEFERAIASFGYHIQGAFYTEGVATQGIEDAAFLLVVQEKTPPHPVSVFQLDGESLRIGRMRMAVATAIYRQCIESGEWPEHTDRIELIGLPAWEARKWEDVA